MAKFLLLNEVVVGIYESGGWESESGAGPEGDVAAADVDIAIGFQPPGAAGVARVRGAGPLAGGSPILIGNLERAGDGQGGALHINPACRLAQLSGRQSENNPLQGAHRVVAVAGGVADFGGADEGADVGGQPAFVGAGKPGIQGAVGVGVLIVAVPHLLVIHILADHQRPPGPVEAAFIVVLCDIKFNRSSTLFDFD